MGSPSLRRSSCNQARGLMAVYNPSQKTQPLGNIVAVGTNVFFAVPDIERQETLHAGRLREQIGCMPELRCLHHNSAGIEDVFLAEQIQPPRPLHQLMIEERVIVWPLGQLSDIKVARHSQFSQKAVKFLLLNRLVLNSRPNPVERL